MPESELPHSTLISWYCLHTCHPDIRIMRTYWPGNLIFFFQFAMYTSHKQLLKSAEELRHRRNVISEQRSSTKVKIFCPSICSFFSIDFCSVAVRPGKREASWRGCSSEASDCSIRGSGWLYCVLGTFKGEKSFKLQCPSTEAYLLSTSRLVVLSVKCWFLPL